MLIYDFVLETSFYANKLFDL